MLNYKYFNIDETPYSPPDEGNFGVTQKNMNFILIFDIGNSNITCAIYSQKKVITTWRLVSDQNKSADEYYHQIKPFIIDTQIDFISISSVVPQISKTFEELIKKYFFHPYIFVNAKTELGLKFHVPDPTFIGADLIVNAFVAKEKYKSNCIIIDLGTATTIQLVGIDGTFYGYVIIPGVQTSKNSIIEKAAQLHDFDFDIPETILGINTIQSLSSGIIRGHAFAIDSFIEDIKNEYTDLNQIKVIMTGGLAEIMQKFTKNIDVIDNSLQIEGLGLVGEMIINASQKIV